MSPDMLFERMSAYINDRLQVNWVVGADSEGIAIGYPDNRGDVDGVQFSNADDFFAFREAVNDLYDHIRQENE